MSNSQEEIDTTVKSRMDNVISLAKERQQRAKEEQRVQEEYYQPYRLEKIDYTRKLDWYTISALVVTGVFCMMWYVAATAV